MAGEVVYLVDGYNVIFAWPELDDLRERSLEEARHRFVEQMSEFQAYSGKRVVVVFDAQHVAGHAPPQVLGGVEVQFTDERETADERIEKSVQKWLKSGWEVYVVTSDYLEQRVTFGQGAFRISARELYREWLASKIRVKEQLSETRARPQRLEERLSPQVMKLFEHLRRRS